jgi:iron-sulfur cluster repair protein YtfE (RIC family)
MAAAEISSLGVSGIMAALRATQDTTLRRTLTAEVYALHRSSWETHQNWRTTLAQHLVKDVHPMFRDGFTKVLRGSEAAGAVDRAYFSSLNINLHSHHWIEDREVFPLMRSDHPEIAAEMDILEQDHKGLRTLEAAIEAGDLAALREFVATLDDHLNREEMLLLPCILSGTVAF